MAVDGGRDRGAEQASRMTTVEGQRGEGARDMAGRGKKWRPSERLVPKLAARRRMKEVRRSFCHGGKRGGDESDDMIHTAKRFLLPVATVIQLSTLASRTRGQEGNVFRGMRVFSVSCDPRHRHEMS